MLENCIFKGRHHLALTKPAQITAARAGGASGVFLGERGKIGTLIQKR